MNQTATWRKATPKVGSDVLSQNFIYIGFKWFQFWYCGHYLRLKHRLQLNHLSSDKPVQ